MKTQPTTTLTPGDHHNEIKQLAYKLWQLADCPSGYDLTFWLHAERQVLTRLREENGRSSVTEERDQSSTSKPAIKSKAGNSAKPARKSPAVRLETEGKNVHLATRSAGLR